ncbi:3'-5' exoribonuclease domain-containing protein [Phytobacter sp. V91]|uniref:3'-5' exonuclease n=1 Tax=Phytobacter sp. V91 TaxID=3369425 RepID=UPI003F5DD86D
MQTYAYLIKAKAKAADAKHLFCWLSAKSDSRADREIANILEDAEIETGRGADYLQPVRTNWHVVDDLPEEGVLDDTWCERYELNDDGLTWRLISKPAPEPEEATVPVESRGVAVRLAVAWLGDKYQTHITKEQQIAASELASGESALETANTYMRNLFQAISDVAEFADLSLNVEWKLVQAVKAVFPLDGEHTPPLLVEFVTDWIAAEPDSRNQLVDDWQSGKLPATPGDGSVADEMEHPIAQMDFQKQVLAAFISEEFRYHITADQRILVADLLMDTDNHYAHDLLLAAGSVPEVKKYALNDLFKLVFAVKKVLPPPARYELNTFLRFIRAWAATEHIDRGLLVNEWLGGKRVAVIQHAGSGETAQSETVDAGKLSAPDSQDIPQFYQRAVTQSDANLSIEIAVALLFPAAEPGKISRNQLLEAKAYQERKDDAHVKAVKVLGKLPDILEYSAWSIYGVTHAIRWHSDQSVVDLRVQARQWLTDNGTYENGQPSKGYPEWDEDPRAARHSSNTSQSDAGEPAADGIAPQVEELLEVARLSKTVFSIEGLMSQQSTTSTTQPQNEDGDDVQMEKAGNDETQIDPAVSTGETANVSTESGPAIGAETVTLEDNIDTGHHISGVEVDSQMTHLMVDLETMGSNPEAPIVAIGAVYFDPNTGITGAEFYQIVSLESAMEFGAKPDGATIIWWLRQSPEARAAITGGDAIGLMDAVDKFDEFVHDNSANGIKSVQLWGNGSSFDNVILRRAYEQVGAELSVPFWNDRDVRTIVELGKAIGINPRHEIPFDGDMHNALADARHQVKYVSAIWQRLVSN